MLGTKLAQRYELVAELGRGGMGVVYRATDPVLSREIAVKLIPPTLLTPESETRFRKEAQIVAQMDHPAIVPIHDLGVHDGSLFFVMPIVEGQSLRALIRSRDLNLGDVLDVGIQVAEALDYAHNLGVVHRDIKPENVMVTRTEGQLRARVMDFGLARMKSDETGLTKTGTLVGTMSYLSPEQVSGSAVDGRSDIYSLGTVLYECLTGAVPFTGELQSILYRIVHEVPQPLRAHGVELDDGVDALILSCLAKNGAERPSTGGRIARDLRSARQNLRDSERGRTLFATRAVAIPRSSLSPFIGRRRELEELQTRLNASIQGECQFVVVAGDQGVGKTRLLDQLEELARARKLPVLHGRFLEQDRSFPFHGFCEAIQEYFRLQENSAGDAETADLSDVSAELVALFPVLSEIPEIQPSSRGSTLAPGTARSPENRTEVYEVLARTFTRLAGGRPLLLFFEDLHAADVSIEALEYIVRRLGPTPTLIVGTYRSRDIDRSHPLVTMLRGFEGDRRFAQMEIGPLTESEYGKFLSTLVGGNDVDPTLVKRLYEGTEGNPFFTKEMVRTLLDSGGISRTGTGVWGLSAEAGLTLETMPATIQQAVEKRIERLPDALREIVAVAAVIGRSFDFEDLKSLLPDEKNLDDSVDALIRDGVLEEDRKSRGDRLAFTSAVVRDVLYTGLSRRRRRGLHSKIAERLEERHGSRRDRIYPELLYHFSEADVAEKSVEYGLLLARRSLETLSADEALLAAKTAMDFLDNDWEGDESVKGEARWLLSRAYQLRGDRVAAAREAEAAVAVFQKTGETARAADALLVAATTAWEDRRAEEAERFLEQGLVAARAAGAVEVQRQLLTLAATMAGLRGEYERANELYAEVERLGGSSAKKQAEEVPSGGRLVVAMSNAPQVRDFADTRLDEEVEMWSNVFETLIGSDERGSPVPLLAESWSVVEEGRVFHFRLRPGIQFHDGLALSAATVKTCFEETTRRSADSLPAVLAPIEGMSDFLENGAAGVTGLRVLGDLDLEIRLRESIPIFPALLRHNSAFVAREGDGTKTRTVGTGPFRFASSDADKFVVQRHDAYWGEAVPRLDTLEFRLGLTGREMASKLRSGEIDVARNLAAEELEELQREPRFRNRMIETPGKNTTLILFNTKSGPVTKDVRIRRALSGVLRVRDLAWRTRGVSAEPAASLICPGQLGHDPGRRRREIGVTEAKQMIEEAVPPSRCLRVLASPATRDRLSRLIQELVSRWSEAGFESELVERSHVQFVESLKNPESFDVLIGGWIADYDDPDAFTHALFDSCGGVYRDFYGSAEIDEIFTKARAETRPGVRETLYRQFEARLQEEAVLVPLFHEVVHRLPGPKVRGLRMLSHPPYSNYAEAGKAESDLVRDVADAASGTLRVPFLGPINLTLDPRDLRFVTEAEILSCIWEPLTRADGARVIPWLASEIRTENQGRRYVFRLRPDVRFHDGRRLTARDVRFTFERALAEENPSAGSGLTGIVGAGKLRRGEERALEGFRILSSGDFTIDLEQPSAFFPAVLSQVGLGILPEGAELRGSSWKDGIVGTGPFRLTHFVPGERVELERDPAYWRAGLPRCRSLVMTSCETETEMVAGLREGKYALIDRFGLDDLEALRKDPEFASGFHDSPSLGVIYLAMQTHDGPLADRALRRRIAEQIDFAGIVRDLGLDSGRPAHGLIPRGLLKLEVSAEGRRGNRSPGPLPSQVSRLRMACSTTFGRSRGDLVTALTAAFLKIGYELDLICNSDAEYNATLRDGAADLALAGWSADFPDIHAIAHALLHSREGLLRSMCGAEHIDELLERAGAEPDVGARHSLYRRVEEIVAQETRVIPLYHLQTQRLARPELEGVKIGYSSPYVAYENLRMRG